MPKAFDLHPDRRGLDDTHSPLKNLLDWTSPMDMTARDAGGRVNSAINAAVSQAVDDTVRWIKDNTGIDLTNIVALTDLIAQELHFGDTEFWTTWFDNMTRMFNDLNFLSPTFDPADAWNIFASEFLEPLGIVLTPSSTLNASNLWGLLGPGVTYDVPATAVTSKPAQPLWNPNFEGAVSFNQTAGWVWDSTVYFESSTVMPGSAKVTADGGVHALRSNPIDVSGGQKITPTPHVLTDGLICTGTPIQLHVITYRAGAQVAVIPLMAMGAAVGATTGWVNPPALSKAGTMTATYTIPNDGTVDSIVLRLVLDSTATVGAVHFGSVPTIIEGGLIADIQTDTKNIIDSFAPGGTSDEFLTGVTQFLAIFNLTPDDVGGAVAIDAVWTSIITGIINPLNALTVQAENIIGDIEVAAINGLTDLLNGLLPTSTYQFLVDAIANALGHSGTGHTWTDIETYFGIIPPANVGNVLGGANLGADVNAVHGNVNDTWGWLFGTTTPPSSPQVMPVAVGGVGGPDSLAETFNTWAAQFGAALGGDVADAGDLAGLAQLMNALGFKAAQTQGVAAGSASTLAIRTNAPTFAGMDNTTQSNMPVTAINTATPAYAGSIGASVVAAVRCQRASRIGALVFPVRKQGSPTNKLDVNLFRVDFANNMLRFLYSFNATTAATIPTANINYVRLVLPGPSNFDVVEGDVILVEFAAQMGSTNSSTGFLVYGTPSTGVVGGHPSALMKDFGGYLSNHASGGWTATADIALSNWVPTPVTPYVGLEISTLPADYQPPVPTTYKTAGTFTHTLQTWLDTGDVVDLAVLGGAGGGGGFVSLSGYGGNAGAFATRRLVVGTDFPVGTTSLTVVVGGPGVGAVFSPANGSAGGASSVAWPVGHSLSGAGGSGGLTNAATTTDQAYGKSPGSTAFQGATYFGGAEQTALGSNGNAPGGGGAGGWSFHSSGGNGTPGQVWIVEQQAA